MSENNIEEILIKGVKKLGGWAVKFLPFTFTGFPDRIVLMPGGRIWFVELKTDKKKKGTLSPRQKIVIPQLLKLGFRVWVVDSKILVDLFLTDIMRERPMDVEILTIAFEERIAA